MRAGDEAAVPALSLAAAGVWQCGTCRLLLRGQGVRRARCPRCGASVHRRHPHSLGTTTALLIAALVLYVPANTLPIMTTRSAIGERSDTIVSGILELLRTGSWPLALIVFVASFLVPLAKLAVLGWLVAAVHLRRPGSRRLTALYRLVEVVGRWSMLDVFVVAILAALVQLGPAAEVTAGPGVVLFGAVVWLTLWATEAFDPRLIWDAAR